MKIIEPFLYPIIDDSRSTDLKHDALEVIRAGAKILQLRAKQISNSDLYQIVMNLVPECKAAGVMLILNDRVDLCLVTGATGVHLGQQDLPVNEVRSLLPYAILGLSTHNITQVQEADRLPVDYISVGPIYPTTSKADPDPVVGVDLLRKAKEVTNKPIVCIGGIQESNIDDLINERANGIAMISEIYRKDDIFKNIKLLLGFFHH